MKVLNFGSLNIDYVYQLDHIAREGETIASSKLEVFCGGKGLNQSIALAKAGAEVYHGGMIGEEGEMLKTACQEAGVDTRFIRQVEGRSGHTMIQVDRKGQNCIVLYGGSNQKITSEFIEETLSYFEKGDMLVLQNEINCLGEIIEKAWEKGMEIVLNPSPYNENLKSCDLGKVSLFLLNEVEGEQMTGERETGAMAEKLKRLYPKAAFVLTLGKEGAEYHFGHTCFRQEIYPVEAVDTTAAGDTFTGYFLAARIQGKEIPQALSRAAMASSIAVSRKGASPSIPYKEEVDEALLNLCQKRRCKNER